MDTVVVFSPAPGPSVGSPNPQLILENTTTQSAYTTSAWTQPSGSNRCVFLCLAISYQGADGTDSTVGTVTWGGNAGTKAAEFVVTGTGATAAIYRWVEADFPAAGSTFTINISAQQTQFRGMTAVAYQIAGVNQTTPVDTTLTEGRADRTTITIANSNGIQLGFNGAAPNTVTNVPITLGAGGVSPQLLLSGESGFGDFTHRSWALVRDDPGATGANTVNITRAGAWWTSVDGQVTIEINPA